MTKNYDVIVLVNFGVGNSEVREKSIDKLYSELKAAFPQNRFELAYTSNMIRSNLKHEGIFVHSPKSVLDMLKAEGLQRVLLFPSHLIAGSEYHKIVREAYHYRQAFENIAVGKPLLSSTEDYKNLAKIINDEYKVPKNEALILMGHGSEHGMNAAYPALAYEFLTHYQNIFLATVEGYPALSDAVALLRKYEDDQGSIQKITLAPLLFVAGVHAHDDMASKEDKLSWYSVLKNLGYNVKSKIQGLGEIPEVRSLYIEHLAQELSPRV